MRLYKPHTCCSTRCSSIPSCDSVISCINTQLTKIANNEASTLVNFCNAASLCVNEQFLALSLNQTNLLTNFGEAIQTYLRSLPGYTPTGDIFLSLDDDVYKWQIGGSGGGSVTSVGLTSSDITVGGTSPITSSGTFTLTLPSINSNIGTFNSVTVNAKGQVTAASNVSYTSGASTIFNSTTDWGASSGGYYSFAFTHNLNSLTVSVEVWDETTTPVVVIPSIIERSSSNIVTIKVTDFPDNRFSGRIVITKV